MPQTTLLYPKEAMEQAVQDVKQGVPVRTAAKRYGVPKTTLLYKSRGDLPVNCRKGPSTVLTAEEEDFLVKWISHVGNKGFPITKVQLLDSVEMIIRSTKRITSFTNSRPGRKWYDSFMKRHPVIAQRVAQNLTASRAAVNEEKIRGWFSEVSEYIDSEGLGDIWQDPKRVFNADETAFFLAPKGEKVLVRRGEKTVYNHISTDEKDNLTTLINVNAAGMFVPPMIVFKYERIPPHITNLMPPEFGIAKSESGWMTGATFYEYVTNIFYPWLVKNEIEFPIAFFVDGHKSHLTMALSNFCSEKKIILIALFPNATHLLQPLDVGVFKPLKAKWKEEIRKWKIENNGAKFKREHFGGVLNEAIKNSISKETIQHSFRCTGLYPFNADAINFGKYFKSKECLKDKENDRKENSVFASKCVKYLESLINDDTLKEFKRSASGKWHGPTEDTSLFNIWKIMSSSAEMTHEQENQEDKVVEGLQDPGDQEVGQIEVNLDKENQIEAENAQSPKVTRETRTPSPLPSSSCIPLCILGTEQEEKGKGEVSNETSPPAVPSSSGIPFNVPSPFKKCLFWPEADKNVKPKRCKEKIPSVAVSEDWKSYYKRKQEVKDKIEKEKEERKRKREENRKNILEAKKIKKAKKNVMDDSSSESSMEVTLESEGEGDDWAAEDSDQDQEIRSDKEFSVGGYVIVRYNDAYYPGRIMRINTSENQVMVSVMNSSGLNCWKWPLTKDEMWYESDDVVQIIAEPTPVNKRGAFKVPELEKYNVYVA